MNTKIWKKAKYYDKISKKEISLRVSKGRIKVGLINTFYVIFHSEDLINEIEKLK